MNSHTDPRVDTYIAKSADFAQPILHHIRSLIHLACPEIEETIKWGMPFFDYKGAVCNMAAFKQHCAFGFWKGALMADERGLLTVNAGQAMGQFGRITAINDLPEDEVVIEYIQKAVQLNESDKKLKRKASEKTELMIPEFFTNALNSHSLAKEKFQKFSYSHQKEYVQWLIEAKTEPTRNKRLNTAIEWLSAGKPRNWKYGK